MPIIDEGGEVVDENEAFLDIANGIHSDEANEMLDEQLEHMRQWAQRRRARGMRVDLKTATEAFLTQNPPRVPMIVCAATALWRLCEIEAEKEDRERK